MAKSAPLDAVVSDDRSYVNWSAIVAGAILASAYSLTLFAFGSAAGLTLVSPFDQTGSSLTIMLVAVALWTIWVQVSGFALGGYVAGRMRPRMHDATEHEVEVRDGIHGVLVWALGLVLGALVLAVATGTVAGIGSQAIGAAAPAAIERAPGVSRMSTEAITDALFRTESATTSRADEAVRGEVGRIVTPSASGRELSADDRTYLVNLVANQTGLTPAEAEKRVDAVLAQAAEAAEKARKAGIIMGFVTAVSLLVSAAAAWWAADLGGHHRDSGTDFGRYLRWRRIARGPAA